MSSIKARRISSQERAVSFGRASGKRPEPSACDRRTYGAIIECDEDVTATEATKADRGALGLKLVTIGELDAHREESPELIGSGSRGYRRGRENVLSKRAGTAGWPRVARQCAGFSRPQLEPEEESPEEAHPRRHIAKARLVRR